MGWASLSPRLPFALGTWQCPDCQAGGNLSLQINQNTQRPVQTQADKPGSQTLSPLVTPRPQVPSPARRPARPTWGARLPPLPPAGARARGRRSPSLGPGGLTSGGRPGRREARHLQRALRAPRPRAPRPRRDRAGASGGGGGRREAGDGTAGSRSQQGLPSADSPRASHLIWARPLATPSAARPPPIARPRAPRSDPHPRSAGRPDLGSIASSARALRARPLPRRRGRASLPGTTPRSEGQCPVSRGAGGTRAGPAPLLPSLGAAVKSRGGEGRAAR